MRRLLAPIRRKYESQRRQLRAVVNELAPAQGDGVRAWLRIAVTRPIDLFDCPRFNRELRRIYDYHLVFAIIISKRYERHVRRIRGHIDTEVDRQGIAFSARCLGHLHHVSSWFDEDESDFARVCGRKVDWLCDGPKQQLRWRKDVHTFVSHDEARLATIWGHCVCKKLRSSGPREYHRILDNTASTRFEVPAMRC